MAIILSDQEIAFLLQEKKSLPDDYRTRIQVRPKRSHNIADRDENAAKNLAKVVEKRFLSQHRTSVAVI